MRILWLYGPQAAGKSVVAWELLNSMSARDPATGYIDIDQLGMLHLDEDDEHEGTEGHKLKGRALAAVAAQFAAKGVRVLVVSGVMAPELTEFYAEELAPYDPVFVRLTVPDAVLRRRLSARGAYAEDWATVEAYARTLEVAAPDHPVIASGPGTPAEVAAAVLEAVGARMSDDQAVAQCTLPLAAGENASTDAEAILIGGTTAVGKSTVGWQAFMETQRQGRPSAFVDLRQLGFVGAGGGEVDHHLQAGAASALWSVFRGYGANLLILNGPVNTAVEMLPYRAALAGTHLNAVRLTAQRLALVARVRARMRGEMAPLAGDSLVGRPVHEADAIADAALRLQNSAGADDAFPALDTTGFGPAESAQRLLPGRE